METYKLIRYLAGLSDELYNLDKDKGEQVNLSTELLEIRDSLSSMLTNWLEETDAKILVPNPEFEK